MPVKCIVNAKRESLKDDVKSKVSIFLMPSEIIESVIEEYDYVRRFL